MDDWDDFAPGLGAALAGLSSLGTTAPRRALDALPSTLSSADRAIVVDQATLALRQLYVHLPFKLARHPVDPLRALELLAGRLDGLSDLEFHGEMIRALQGFRDLHTHYRCPPPYDGMLVFLPFLAERCVDPASPEPRLVVTRMLAGFEHEVFGPGTEIEAWNGVPTERTLRASPEAAAGANEAAQAALAVQYLTVRWLGTSRPPEEEWVVLTCSSAGARHELRLPWVLLTLDEQQGEIQIGEQAVWKLAGASGLLAGLNTRSHVEHLARRRLFAPHKAEPGDEPRPKRAPRPAGPPGAPVTSVDPSIEARVLPEAGGFHGYGYLRLRSFAPGGDADGFVAEIRRLLGVLPRHGLVIDIRGNPGGTITAAERLLQLFTPRTVEPLPFQFLATPLTRAMATPDPVAASADAAEIAARWGPSIEVAVASGAPYSAGIPVTLHDQANDIGQVYRGPVVLVTDGITYSAADMFAAGFQDHAVGPVLGTDSSTGAGGANMWSHGSLDTLAPAGAGLHQLPAGVDVGYASRRCLRGGALAGMPLEEFGVRPDLLHVLTRDDVLGGNDDLLRAAAALLHHLPVRRLDVEVAPGTGEVGVEVVSDGIDRLDVFVGSRPVCTLDVATAETATHVAVPARPGDVLVVRGYLGGALVAGSRTVVPGSAPAPTPPDPPAGRR